MVCFSQRHPTISFQSMSALEISCASACSKKSGLLILSILVVLLQHSLESEPSKIWRCNKGGFALCAKTGKILTPVKVKSVYSMHTIVTIYVHQIGMVARLQTCGHASVIIWPVQNSF